MPIELNEVRLGVEFIDETRLARALCFSLSTVRRWRDTWKASGGASGTGPRPYRFGRLIRYRVDEVEAWASQYRGATKTVGV
jgi:hypothetical protein